MDTSDIHTKQAVEPEVVLQPVSIIYHHQQGDWEIGYTTTSRKQPLHDGQLLRARYKANCLAASLRSVKAVPKCLIHDMEVCKIIAMAAACISFLALLVLFCWSVLFRFVLWLVVK